MIWATVAVVLGIALTVISADKFVEGAASLASRLGMSHFLIGLTIVSIGTSAPELLSRCRSLQRQSRARARERFRIKYHQYCALVLGQQHAYVHC